VNNQLVAGLRGLVRWLWPVAGMALVFTLTSCAAGTEAGGTVNAALFGEPSDAPLVPGRAELDAAAYTRIPLLPEQLTVSSTFREDVFSKANLVRSGTQGYWHVMVPRVEARPWITVDMRTEQAVAAVGVLGREDLPQMWTGYHAVLEGSEDGAGWILLGRLGMDKATVKGWTYFVLPEPRGWRYYRLSVHEWGFMSMARLNLYTAAGTMAPLPEISAVQRRVLAGRRCDLSAFDKIALAASQLTVSRLEGPSYAKDNLLRPGAGGFWHVKTPRGAGAEWIIADLMTPRAVSLLRLLPRAGYPSHLWVGYAATLEASHDRESWDSLGVLGVDKADLTGEWLNFLVGNTQSYRYYRLVIRDRYFLSMARLELYEFHEGVLHEAR
jgi:hypothetical protein